MSFAAKRDRHCTLSEHHAYEQGRRHAAWDFAKLLAESTGQEVSTPDTRGIRPHGVRYPACVRRPTRPQGFRFGGFLGKRVGPQTNGCTFSYERLCTCTFRKFYSWQEVVRKKAEKRTLQRAKAAEVGH